MHLKYFEQQFNKRNIQIDLNPGLDENEFGLNEERLNVIFPKSVKIFYSYANGFTVKSAGIVQSRVEEWKISEDQIIQFMFIGEKVKIGFDISHFNDANEWNIINCENKNVITLTMANLWSNKIWKWIDKKKMFWNNEF